LPTNKWIEVSITVEAELAEPVAEVFARFAPNDVVIESTQIVFDPEFAEDRAIGPMRVFCYFPLDNQFDNLRDRLEEALWYLGCIHPLPKPRFLPVQQEDWTEIWKKHYKPIPIGKKLIIIPAWLEATNGARIPIRINPGMAFGTGTHPTTQLCLEILESLLDSNAYHKTEVIDIGCGTAILAIAALKLGADYALGVDLDANAIHAASENAERNGVAEILDLGVGSLAEIQAGSFSISRAQLVIANILSPVLIRMLDDDLDKLLMPGGSLILSGILEGQLPEVETALNRYALGIIERRQIEDWIALVCRSMKEV
jgi:ribosomal protein L11 methyltransferase